ncbi:hypothetical protein [Helicobacter salomonis]|uniref:hypothetical protein n=1 Tax=Helicobacter salomonis TaxID=56878 RepID=UPI000CF05FE9|nr:hypothetical protein [Helicobacter salomonis]
MLFEVDRIATLHSQEFLELLKKGEPYGVGNEIPRFAVCARLKDCAYMGRALEHARFILEDDSGVLKVLWWFHKLPRLQEGDLVRVVGTYDHIDRKLFCLELQAVSTL